MAEPQSADYPDEVSLRDLYLTFRAGLPLIVLVTLVVGVAVALFVLSRPRVYEATAVVHVLPSTVSPAAASTVTLTTPVGVDLETYRQTALAREVLDAIEIDLPLEDLAARLELSPTPAAQLSRGQQVVAHTVTLRDATKVAPVANSWAEATVDELRRVLSLPLDTAIAAAAAEMGRRAAEFDAASAAWADFLARDERPALRARLAAAEGTQDTTVVREALAALEAEAGAIQRDMAAAQLAFHRSAPLLGQLELQRDLVSDSATVAVRASAPLEPLSRNLVPLTLAGAVVAGLLATLFVFLRRAVSPG